MQTATAGESDATGASIERAAATTGAVGENKAGVRRR
jgi:hypothetical protein